MSQAGQQSPLSGPASFVVSRRRRWLLLAGLAVGLLAAGAVTLLQAPVYRASTQILIEPATTDPLTGAAVSTDPLRVMQTEVQVVTSAQVRVLVAEKLGSAPTIAAVPEGQSNVLTISAEADSARRAARVANVYATSYISYSKREVLDKLKQARDDAQRRLEALRAQVAELTGDDPSTNADRDALVTEQSALRQRIDQLDSGRALADGGATVLTQATAPESPTSPRPLRNLAAGLVVGLLLGAALVVVDDRYSRRRARPAWGDSPIPSAAHVSPHEAANPVPGERGGEDVADQDAQRYARGAQNGRQAKTGGQGQGSRPQPDPQQPRREGG